MLTKNIVFSDREKQEYIHGRNGRDTFEYIFKRSITDDEIEELTEEKEIIYRQKCLNNIMEFAPGAISFIEYLIENEIEMAIATASGKKNVDFFIEHFDLLRYFREDHIIYNDGKARGKPFPDLFNSAIRVLGIAKEQITVFEDSTSGIDAANNAGVGNIIIVNSANKNFAQYNHQVIRHFDEVERGNFN